MRIDEFITQCNSLVSETSLEYQQIAPSIKFSNTGRRGMKYFSIPLQNLIDALNDIKNNIIHFSSHAGYVEGIWRDLFANYLTNDVTVALAGVQTFPMFSLLNKVITVSNSLPNYNDKHIPLSVDYIDNAIKYLSSQMPDNQAYLNLLTLKKIDKDRIKVGINKIFYGAPGTGKSHAIDQITKSDYTIRTVFHPDTQYSDFIGSLKPVMNNSVISYQFRPGSFTDAIIIAVNNPNKECTLVIEEINRAAAAAAFGEIFQLLDRTTTRESRYPINVSDPDWLNYLNSQTDNYFSNGKLVIPSNLNILATMNSSDQAVMPLDTAFKRRWEFEYLPISYESASTGTLPLPLENDEGNIEVLNVHWADFAKIVNSALAEDHIPEDKLLGHRFLDTSELNENGINALKGKLFMYLWDDVLRHGQRGTIFAEYITDEDGTEIELTTYGQLIQAYSSNKSILRDSIAKELFSLTKAREANS
ncbi:AAA family ATPase [Vibrio cholerae]|uniref:AAA family ATPase n=1 Tax=Vibrio cholerae TaxID=666 RepID=UPI0015591020|nr:AAA family ATPase [Vibrio cholerae]CAB1250295.1 5-methylcytosine-specific restriction enzyme B [Vibrio cholerae]HDI3311680.1 AAA family ATPase [Vibrio cholerae]